MSTNTKILIVEDSPTYTKILINGLTGEGYDCLHAESGLKARDLLTNGLHFFDLVISDFEMPEMSGIELAKWMRAQNDFKTIPFILISGSIKYAEFSEALNSGAINSYLTKPFSPQSLNRLVATYLSRKLATNDKAA